MKRLSTFVLGHLGYLLNGVTAAGVLISVGLGLGPFAVAAALLAGALYEHACWRHQRRLLWPFSTAGTRNFERHADDVSDIVEARRRVRAETRTIESATDRNERRNAAFRRIVDAWDVDSGATIEWVALAATIEGAETVGDNIVLDVNVGNEGFVEARWPDGELVRADLNGYERHFRLPSHSSADAAMLCVDLMEQSVSMHAMFESGKLSYLDIAGDDGRSFRIDKRDSATRNPER